MGFSHISDMNTPVAPADGLSTLESSVNEKRQRVSAFEAFLPKELALSRVKNLTICTETIVSRIGVSRDEGQTRAEEVFFQDANSKSTTKVFSAKAKREVVVCLGAIGSP